MKGDHVHYTRKRVVSTRVFDDNFRLMLKKIYSISRARVSFVEIKDKKEKNPHAFVSGTSRHAPYLHRHGLHKVVHGIAALLQSRRDKLLSQAIEAVAALS
jgi:hypothetical protein